MKRLVQTLCALGIVGTPLSAQTTIIGGATNNGDFETGVINPFGPFGGALSDAVANTSDQNHTESGQYALKIDLTANNGDGQWKGITTLDDTVNGVIGEYDIEGGTVNSSVWVYIPQETQLGTNALFEFQLEARNANDPVNPDAWDQLGTTLAMFDLAVLTRDTWHLLERVGDLIPEGTTHIRTRPWNINTVNEFPNPEDPENPIPAFGEPGPDNGNATPADWIAAGYNGFIYIDDIKLEILPPVSTGSTTVNLVICEDIGNGNFEGDTLTPWNPTGGSAQPDPSLTPPEGGVQSLAVDLTEANAFGQWKPVANIAAPVSSGDLIEYSTWVYVPADTTGGDNLKFAVPLRSDNGGGGFGNIGGWPAIDLNNDVAVPRDTWVQFRYGPVVAINGPDDQPITSINTKGMNVESLASTDLAGAGYGGNIYIDNFKLTVTSSPEPVDGVLSVVSSNENNGTMEATTMDPWGGSGVSLSTDQNHTEGGSQSLEIDLTANNSGGSVDLSAKRFLDRALLSSVAGTADTDTIDLSAWVFVPSSTTFGAGDGILSLEISDHTLTPFHFLELDLADDGDAPRDQWVLLEDTGIPIPEGTEAESLIFTSFQVYTTDLIIINEGTPEEEELDADDPRLTPEDWVANGYTGSVFIDDISVSVTRAPVTEIQITSAEFPAGGGGFSITYLPAEAAVDVYHTTDLETFTPFQLNVTGGTITDGDAADVPKGFYYIFPAGATPPGGN